MKKNSLPVFPLLYAAPIEYYALMVQFDAILLEKKEHFVKQSFRNRCEIVGANGVLRLSIPTHRKGRERTLRSLRKIIGIIFIGGGFAQLIALHRISNFMSEN